MSASLFLFFTPNMSAPPLRWRSDQRLCTRPSCILLAKHSLKRERPADRGV